MKKIKPDEFIIFVKFNHGLHLRGNDHFRVNRIRCTLVIVEIVL